MEKYLFRIHELDLSEVLEKIKKENFFEQIELNDESSDCLYLLDNVVMRTSPRGSGTSLSVYDFFNVSLIGTLENIDRKKDLIRQYYKF